MAIAHAEPGEMVDVRPLGAALKKTETSTLVKANDFELIRLIVPAGKTIPAHKAKGEIVAQCLEGKVAFSVFGNTHELDAGRLIYLPTGELHSVWGIEDSALLLYILLPRK